MKKYVTKHDKVEKFQSGAARGDRTDKGRFDLISPVGLRRLAGVYERGATQKGENNWMKGFPLSRCLDSALRHLNQYREGDRSEDHVAQACWNLFAAMHFEEMIEKGQLSPELYDLPQYPSPVKSAK